MGSRSIAIYKVTHGHVLVTRVPPGPSTEVNRTAILATVTMGPVEFKLHVTVGEDENAAVPSFTTLPMVASRLPT